MVKPLIPENETLRLNSLKALNILDTPREERFDRLTKLACGLFGTQIAVISFIDAEREWIKAEEGLFVSQIPREYSFSAHAILREVPFIIMDAIRDARFSDNPLVVGDPNVRFYAGCPISIDEGIFIGVFCIMDTQPRDLSNQEFNLLCDIARMTERELTIERETLAKKASRIVGEVKFKLIKTKNEREEKRDEGRKSDFAC